MTGGFTVLRAAGLSWISAQNWPTSALETVRARALTAGAPRPLGPYLPYQVPIMGIYQVPIMDIAGLSELDLALLIEADALAPPVCDSERNEPRAVWSELAEHSSVRLKSG
jgi:endonuclease G